MNITYTSEHKLKCIGFKRLKNHLSKTRNNEIKRNLIFQTLQIFMSFEFIFERVDKNRLSYRCKAFLSYFVSPLFHFWKEKK
jgi:hypothetical protein